MTGLAAARVSFAESGELLRELAGLDIDAKLAERQAEALGREIADDERQVVEPEPATARTLYLGLDGTGVPVRKAETRDRRGKQPDGSAKTREAKIGAVWSADTSTGTVVPCATPAPSPTAPSSRPSPVAIPTPTPRPSPAALGAKPKGDASTRPRVARSSATAPSGYGTGRTSTPPAPSKIVDIFHAKERLSDVAKDIYGAGTDLADQWGKQRRDELDRGRVDDILAALRGHAETCDDARECVDYIDNNRHRMRYPEFRAMGLCVATGVVEGGCKNIVASRLKRDGMHWTVSGANAIIALRCAILSNRFDDFWKRRANAC